MHIIAISNLPDNKDTLAPVLAVAMGSPVYEALARLKIPGEGPLVVGVYAAIGPAEELLRKLRDSGFDAVLLKEDEIEAGADQITVRTFSLGSDTLVVESRKKESLTVSYSRVDLIIRGTSIAQTSVTEVAKEKKFSPGAALMTGGLKMTKTTERVTERAIQSSEEFLLLYAQDEKTLAFKERELLYDSLGSSLCLTRQANFSYLIEELRGRCPKALYDDRLLNRAGQVQLLGRSLSPEEHIRIATALLAKVLRPGNQTTAG